MATPRRRPHPALTEQLFDEPYRFDFFQAVRLLARIRPESEPVGRSVSQRDEVVRFRALASLAFPPSPIQAIRPADDPLAPPEMTVAFMGLTGPTGVLPHCYTEMLIERNRAGDRTAAAFLDLLNHRLISLFYRAWEKYRPYLMHETSGEDGTSKHLFDLIGLGLEPLRGRNAFPDEAQRFFSGFFARRHRPAVVLAQLLNDYFGIPVKVLQFVGHWLPLAPEDRSRLGASGAYNELAASLVLGARVRDVQGKFRLRLGSLTFEKFLAFAPDGDNFRALAQMTRMYVDAEFTFDVQVVLAAEEVPACRLGPPSPTAPRLGRSAWLKSRPFSKDADDPIFPSGD